MAEFPFCSVVMAVYNGAETVSDAVKSVLAQTMQNFEFIIVNDASIDDTANILSSFADSRIKIISNKKNSGLAASLNKGIAIAKGKYIIRMDADDISMPDRFGEQVNFMEADTGIGICGTWFESFGYNAGIVRYETKDVPIKLKMLHECHILHPSIIIRADAMKANNLKYDESLRKNQDYDFFIKAIGVLKFANIPKILVKYRQTEANFNRTGFNQKSNNILIKSKLFKKLGIDVDEKDMDLFQDIAYYNYRKNKDFVGFASVLLGKMVVANNKTGLYPKEEFNKYIAGLWKNTCINTTGPGLYSYRAYRKSSLRKWNENNIAVLLKLLVKGLIKI